LIEAAPEEEFAEKVMETLRNNDTPLGDTLTDGAAAAATVTTIASSGYLVTALH
jgi:hypothetical protein